MVVVGSEDVTSFTELELEFVKMVSQAESIDVVGER